jgi:hypothetical protein
MRSACSAFLFAALLLAGCGRQADSEGAEFTKLESALAALGGSPEGEWLERLADVKKLSLTSPRVTAVRDKCTAAYEVFGEATARLTTAREDVAKLEESLHGAVDGGPKGDIATLHEKARRATDGVNDSLDAAEKLVRECGDARRTLREALVAP